MVAGFVLTLREGLEAALIIGLLLGTLKKLGQTEYQRTVWFGAASAAFLSVFVGIFLNMIGASLEGRTEEIFEGITMLLAASLLTWVILWMRTRSKKINQKLAADVTGIVSEKNRLALFMLAFISIFREGLELAFFLSAVSLTAGGPSLLLGASLGLAAVVVVAVLLFRSLLRLNLNRFFQITSMILVFFAAGLVAHGVHEFNELGFIPPLIEHLWDFNPILDEKSSLGELLKALLGYNGNPSLTEVFSYLLYLILLGVGYFAGKKDKTVSEKVSRKKLPD
jgi:high-affinity iron transporter